MARFFNALVLFSAAASASNCGGQTTDPKGNPPPREELGSGGTGAAQQAPSSGGKNASMPNGEASGGTGEHTGGVSSATGGSFTNSGGANTGGASSGGAGAASGGLSVLPAETVAQWDCSAQFGECYSDFTAAGYVLGAPCPVDVSRPRVASDCASTEWFECISAYAPNGAHIAVNCRCTPYDGNNCTCLSTPGITATCADHEKLCRCAFPGILLR